MTVFNFKLGNGLSRTGRMALSVLLLAALSGAPSASLAQRIDHPVSLGEACKASAKPQPFAGKVIVDRLLIGDVSPHGYLYQSRHCKLELAVFWTASLGASDVWEHLSRMFYQPMRLPTEVGPRFIEATITGHVVRHKFPEGDKPVWAFEIERLSDLTVAPEGSCAVDPRAWFDLQKTDCNQAKATGNK
jgi:hypothetical protein